MFTIEVYIFAVVKIVTILLMKFISDRFFLDCGLQHHWMPQLPRRQVDAERAEPQFRRGQCRQIPALRARVDG